MYKRIAQIPLNQPLSWNGVPRPVISTESLASLNFFLRWPPASNSKPTHTPTPGPISTRSIHTTAHVDLMPSISPTGARSAVRVIRCRFRSIEPPRPRPASGWCDDAKANRGRLMMHARRERRARVLSPSHCAVAPIYPFWIKQRKPPVQAAPTLAAAAAMITRSNQSNRSNRSTDPTHPPIRHTRSKPNPHPPPTNTNTKQAHHH